MSLKLNGWLTPRPISHQSASWSLKRRGFDYGHTSLGLYQSGHASLDYRVRDASVVKTYLAGLLADLRKHVQNSGSIAQGERVPIEQDMEGSVRDDGSNKSSTSSSLSWASDAPSFHEARFRLESVTERIDKPMAAAARIRHPRNRPRLTTYELFKDIPESERAEYIELQVQTEIAIVAYIQRQELLGGLRDHQSDAAERKSIMDQYCLPTHWLMQRSGMANARRKQQFVYWKRHAELLSRTAAIDTAAHHTVPPADSSNPRS
ncbi:hypothetical protein B0H66DRAFT_639643 [Apodospora peruviana]|uniref:Uncharacterized protein n=1 Tax=Apodospora peruviana TaxID=516989 RepID=A0AAE0I4V4_9PEZI|nr:hypothetical protein B0H66DRAFT_639643 [Apodospora peruviana]